MHQWYATVGTAMTELGVVPGTEARGLAAPGRTTDGLIFVLGASGAVVGLDEHGRPSDRFWMPGPVTALTALDDDRYVIGSGDGRVATWSSVRVVPASLDELVADACVRLARPFTASELAKWSIDADPVYCQEKAPTHNSP